jgi:hypothetical protein
MANTLFPGIAKGFDRPVHDVQDIGVLAPVEDIAIAHISADGIGEFPPLIVIGPIARSVYVR